MSNNSTGKLIFSNPPHPDSTFKVEMKDISQVPVFNQEPHVSGEKMVKGTAMPQVAVYSDPIDVVVTATNPLVISGTGPVDASFGTVTIEPGGQILVYTAANINIVSLKKM